MPNTIKIIIKALDDQEAVKLGIEHLFEGNAFYDVQCFSNPESFIQSITTDTDIIITDFRVDRFDAVSSIKELSLKFPGIVTIVISAYFTEDILHQLIRCRVNDTVIKKGDWLPELLNSVNNLVPLILNKKKVLEDDY